MAAAAQVFVADLQRLEVTPEDHHHLVRARRLRTGELVVACDGTGAWCRCVVHGDSPSNLLRRAGDVVLCPAPAVAVTVAFVPVKGDRPEWVVQKLTEVGVDRLVVLHSERAVVQWSGERLRSHLRRFERIAREAAAQSRRPWVPAVVAAHGLDELDALVAGAGPASVAQRGAPPPGHSTAVLAVGPEGGFTADELRHRPAFGLGPAVLRAETAAVAAGVLLCARRDGIVGEGAASDGPVGGSAAGGLP